MSVTQGTWNTGEQIRSHKLACSIINFHDTADAVLDDSELDLLESFTNDPSTENRDRILRAKGWADQPGQRRGSKAAENGSLVGHLISRYGSEEPALDDRDWELLTEWFGKGMPTGEHVQR
ncbi:uncharacterized protein Z520_11501 [Fonsecaea multimorphosa CBS 102226]|uniref:Uncharacterized protein n=1 Tax=Fonsecaea multimorphosa CBS 102226 TaxID=1442371 RepID=A0A0D2K911_9EURO|nr:uncharacterized protein Z520_11501 [Fonsecaea multimorphosa CBS 102226]KIX92838.1 hypothetical protein Z520_11501 [Fonsecaea multimorphosa CBS 102226]OAL18086.1 hypothetical protein AYO22_11008 [Fonsecaea multimorphosa]